MSPAEELLMVEKQKVERKIRKLELMEQMLAVIERNTQAVSDICDFYILTKNVYVHWYCCNWTITTVICTLQLKLKVFVFSKVSYFLHMSTTTVNEA